MVESATTVSRSRLPRSDTDPREISSGWFGPIIPPSQGRSRVKQTLGDTALLDRGLQAAKRWSSEGQYYLRSGSRVEIVPELPGDESELSSSE